jgi:hypothetical protein
VREQASSLHLRGRPTWSHSANRPRIHHAWNDALAVRNVEAITALYADDATIDSPLVRYLLGSDEGICRGRASIRAFIPLVSKHQPEERRTHRNPVFTDGHAMMWEYPRETPEGDQMDFTEIMEIRDGFIWRHRV